MKGTKVNLREVTVQKNWLSVEEVGHHLGVSKETVYRMLEQDANTIPAHRLGKLWRFNKDEVDTWLKNQ